VITPELRQHSLTPSVAVCPVRSGCVGAPSSAEGGRLRLPFVLEVAAAA
jgi:hypothetical protein